MSLNGLQNGEPPFLLNPLLALRHKPSVLPSCSHKESLENRSFSVSLTMICNCGKQAPNPNSWSTRFKETFSMPPPSEEIPAASAGASEGLAEFLVFGNLYLVRATAISLRMQPVNSSGLWGDRPEDAWGPVQMLQLQSLCNCCVESNPKKCVASKLSKHSDFCQLHVLHQTHCMMCEGLNMSRPRLSFFIKGFRWYDASDGITFCT